VTSRFKRSKVKHLKVFEGMLDDQLKQ